MQLKFFLMAAAAFVPLAVSTSVGTKNQSCSQGQFWWSEKECCLKSGGPSEPPSPPKDTNCPPTSYYWNEKQGCCTPRNPPPNNAPTPQCPKGWTWYPALHRCQITPTPPQNPPSKPSGYPGGGRGGGRGDDDDDNDNQGDEDRGGRGYHRKRSLKARTTLCPTGLDACPISGLSGDYECLDTSSELESCGGCASLGKGQDCTAIPGAWNVGCDRGRCIVFTCSGGFQIGPDGKSCLPL